MENTQTSSVAADAVLAQPEVRVAAGVVRGRWRPTTGGTGNPQSAAFLGIPFAEAPVGELRFAAPVPKAPWEGVFDAAEFGATAQRGDPGVTLIPEPSVEGDSTLNVNVYTPAIPADPAADATGMPVLVYIHGGGYFAGSPASPWYDGRNFNRDGVVTVTISYRLGFDGFGWIEDAPSNRGVRDWLLALEWVQRNIAAFGGDPARVTIAGQSAGGGAVMTLLGMEKAQHLFHGVYAISGALADVSAARSEEFGRRLAAELGVAPTREGLGALSEERILEAQKKLTAFDGGDMSDIVENGLPLGPSVDGDLILRPTPDSFRAGVGSDKPLVLGATDDEFTMAMGDAAKMLRWVPTGMLLGKLGVAKPARKAYLAANADVQALGKARLAGRVLTDKMFRRAILRIVADRGAAPTWVYRFSWPSVTFGFAEHCLDVPFFFDCLDGPAMVPLAGPNPPQALADEVHGAAVAFIAGGDPGWTRYDRDGVARVFDTPSRDVRDAYASVRPLLEA
ncbi:carboxylesterase family protein [Microbacterium sp. Au-Mic1]|uniref:carboxylesterase/lipase family protein n=1 Tax=Microbacterium sp. Au-Mic1 TaxID=2906457 RepID=UPI001E5013D7|nr:carboxylesterase family protein [Microbacterium sp. Au-Mic1]MCE4026344.1 carboxylesterase family protein [Microbacterium sp. Au-Mic1]